ncbi:hypothetical protein JALI103349_28405 [Janthinobacterium lividum]
MACSYCSTATSLRRRDSCNSARSWPPWNSGCVTCGANDQLRALPRNRSPSSGLAKPSDAVSDRRGKKAARAAPISAFAATSAYSACRMSGRRASKSDGRPGGSCVSTGWPSSGRPAGKSVGNGAPSSSSRLLRAKALARSRACTSASAVAACPSACATSRPLPCCAPCRCCVRVKAWRQSSRVCRASASCSSASRCSRYASATAPIRAMCAARWPCCVAR